MEEDGEFSKIATISYFYKIPMDEVKKKMKGKEILKHFGIIHYFNKREDG